MALAREIQLPLSTVHTMYLHRGLQHRFAY